DYVYVIHRGGIHLSHCGPLLDRGRCDRGQLNCAQSSPGKRRNTDVTQVNCAAGCVVKREAYSSDTAEIDSTKIRQRNAYRLQNRMQVGGCSSHGSPKIHVIAHVNSVRDCAVAANEPQREVRRVDRIQGRRCGASCSAGWCALAGDAKVKSLKLAYI